MWQPNNVHYVYGQRNRHTTLTVGIRYATLIAGIIILILAAFGLGRITTAAPKDVNYELPQVSLPASPQLSELKAPPIVNGDVVSRDIEAYLQANKLAGRVDVSVRSLQDNSSVTVGGEKEYNPASLYKLMLLPVLYERYDSKDFETIKIGDKTLGGCIQSMLVKSDNCSEEVVKRLFGWQAIEAKMVELGYPSLRINDEGGMSINAAEYNRFVAALYHGKLLTEDQRQFVFQNLSRQVYNRGIPAGCSDCQVMNKTGDNGVRHDSAIIEADGNIYALTVLTDGLSYADIASITDVVMKSVRANQWTTL